MKNLIASFLLLLTSFYFVSNLSAQDYQPLAIEGAHWQVHYQPPNSSDASYGFSIEGDTIYNDIAYKKVYKFDLLTFYNNDSWIPYLVFNENESKYLFGLLRDDIIERKVYSVIFNENDWLTSCQSLDEQLLYDFSIAVSDTVITCTSPEFPYQDGNAHYFVVDSISTENTWGEERRKFHNNFSISQYERLTEGLGFQEILYNEALLTPTTLDWSIRLWDYCIGTDDECLTYLVDTTDDLLQQKKQIKLYPNPTNSPKIQIESLEKLSKNTTLHLFNAIGQEISQVKLIQQTQTLTLPYRGVFYYKIVTGHQIIDSGMIERL